MYCIGFNYTYAFSKTHNKPQYFLLFKEFGVCEVQVGQHLRVCLSVCILCACRQCFLFYSADPLELWGFHKTSSCNTFRKTFIVNTMQSKRGKHHNGIYIYIYIIVRFFSQYKVLKESFSNRNTLLTHSGG